MEEQGKSNVLEFKRITPEDLKPYLRYMTIPGETEPQLMVSHSGMELFLRYLHQQDSKKVTNHKWKSLLNFMNSQVKGGGA